MKFKVIGLSGGIGQLRIDADVVQENKDGPQLRVTLRGDAGQGIERIKYGDIIDVQVQEADGTAVIPK